MDLNTWKKKTINLFSYSMPCHPVVLPTLVFDICDLGCKDTAIHNTSEMKRNLEIFK